MCDIQSTKLKLMPCDQYFLYQYINTNLLCHLFFALFLYLFLKQSNVLKLHHLIWCATVEMNHETCFVLGDGMEHPILLFAGAIDV